jgi:hypothetical protein
VREDVAEVAAQQVLRPALEEDLGGGVQVDEPALVIEAVDGVGDAGQQLGLAGESPVVVRSHAARSRPLFVGPRTAEITARMRPSAPTGSVE